MSTLSIIHKPIKPNQIASLRLRKNKVEGVYKIRENVSVSCELERPVVYATMPVNADEASIESKTNSNNQTEPMCIFNIDGVSCELKNTFNNYNKLAIYNARLGPRNKALLPSDPKVALMFMIPGFLNTDLFFDKITSLDYKFILTQRPSKDGMNDMNDFENQLIACTSEDSTLLTVINDSFNNLTSPQFKLIQISKDRCLDITNSQEFFSQFRSYDIQLGVNYPWGKEPIVDKFFNVNWPVEFEQTCTLKNERSLISRYKEIFENSCNKFLGYLFSGCSNVSFIARSGMLTYNVNMHRVFNASETLNNRMDLVFHGTSSTAAKKICASGLKGGTRNFHGICNGGYTTPMFEKAFQFARDHCFTGEGKGAIVVIKMRVGNYRVKDVGDHHSHDDGEQITGCDTLLIRSETKMSTCLKLCNNLPDTLYWQSASTKVNNLLPIGIITIDNDLVPI